MKEGVYLATSSDDADLCDNPDAPCYPMLCRNLCFLTNEPISCIMYLDVTNLLYKIDDVMESRMTPIQEGENDETSPSWTCMSRPHHQVSNRRQVGQRVRFGFSRHACTKTTISPSYGVQIRHSWMRWNHYDKTLLLILVLAPETSSTILWDHRKVLHHLFWTFSGLVSCRALSPYCERPTLVVQP